MTESGAKREAEMSNINNQTMDSYIEGLFAFIDSSPTSFHAAANVGQALEEAGFQRLYETKSWQIESGKKYFVDRNDSAVIAFSIPQKEQKGFHIVAAHSDSPCFKLKELPELSVEEHYLKWNV